MHITTITRAPFQLPATAALRFLSIVDTSRVPLHIALGPKLEVWTTSTDTEDWFSNLLLSGGEEKGLAEDHNEEQSSWWDAARIESPLGILAAVENDQRLQVQEVQPRITEILFYAARKPAPSSCPPTPPRSSPARATDAAQEPSFQLTALALSSELLYTRSEDLTPPPSPSPSSSPTCFTFLPPSFPEPVHTLAARSTKRKSLHDTFEEAAAQRKRAKQHGGSSVAAAAASAQPQPKDRRTVSGSHLVDSAVADASGAASKQASVPLQTRPLSRSPSLSGSRPPTRRIPLAAADGKQRSSLSRVESISSASALTNTGDAAIEAKNRDVISRLVMAGMRLYGLSQSKSRKSRRPSVAASLASQSQLLRSSPAAEEVEQRAVEEDKAKDEAYKLIYHQTFKGAVFAFRQHIGTQTLQPYTEVLRETVDKLLGLFCNDPLANGLGGMAAVAESERVTPGGRKAFGVDVGGAEEESPFARPIGDGEGQGEHTPTWRRKGKEKEKDVGTSRV